LCRYVEEEFMSITDGQVMIDSYSPERGWGISVKDSVSRIGTPGAAVGLRTLNQVDP
jgi:F0F1-type ATP synthase alpha subunit